MAAIGLLRINSIQPFRAFIKPNLRLLAKQELEFLSYHFDLDVQLRWSSGRRRGIYLPSEKVILLGPEAWNGVLDTLLHTVAHCYVHQHRIADEYHGFVLRESLWEIICFYYKDPMAYAWYNEPYSIHEFARIRYKEWLANQEFTLCKGDK